MQQGIESSATQGLAKPDHGAKPSAFVKFDEFNTLKSGHQAAFCPANDPGDVGVGLCVLYGADDRERMRSVSQRGEPKDAY